MGLQVWGGIKACLGKRIAEIGSTLQALQNGALPPASAVVAASTLSDCYPVRTAARPAARELLTAFPQHSAPPPAAMSGRWCLEIAAICNLYSVVCIHVQDPYRMWADVICIVEWLAQRGGRGWWVYAK